MKPGTQPSPSSAAASNVVKFPDPMEGYPGRPCPAKLEGPFLVTDATWLCCGETEGHDGPHRFLVEWQP